MSKAEQFEALALRCEQATGADGNLDKAILLAIGYSWRGMEYWHYDNKRVRRNQSIFTASLDAALTLVPAKSMWSAFDMDEGPFAQVIRPMPDGSYVGGLTSSHGRTPALALCAAALRARAQMEMGE